MILSTDVYTQVRPSDIANKEPFRSVRDLQKEHRANCWVNAVASNPAQIGSLHQENSLNYLRHVKQIRDAGMLAFVAVNACH